MLKAEHPRGFRRIGLADLVPTPEFDGTCVVHDKGSGLPVGKIAPVRADFYLVLANGITPDSKRTGLHFVSRETSYGSAIETLRRDYERELNRDHPLYRPSTTPIE